MIPCLLVFSFEKIGNPPLIVCISLAKVYLNGLGKLSDGFVIVAFHIVEIPPSLVKACNPRIFLDDLDNISNGFILIVTHGPCGFCQPNQIQKFHAVAESIFSPCGFGYLDDVIIGKVLHIRITAQ